MNKSLIMGRLHQALEQGEAGIEAALTLLQVTLETSLWQAEFAKFVDFVTAPPPQGLGTTFERLWHLCLNEPLLLDLLDQTVQQPTGAPVTSNAVQRPSGTSRQAGLRRLRKDAPHLHQAVLEGAMSVNAALIEAGLRTKQITIPVDPEKAAEALKRAFTQTEIETLIAKLKNQDE